MRGTKGAAWDRNPIVGLGVFPLDEPVSSIEDLFDFMSLSPIGRRVISEFIPKYEKGEFRIRPLNMEITRKLRLGKGLKGSVEAAFVYDGKEKTIFVNMRCRQGLLVPLLFHEMVHALDLEYLESYEECDRLWKKFTTRAQDVLDRASKRKGKTVKEVHVDDCSKREFRELRELKSSFEKANHVRLFKTEWKAYQSQFQLTQELAERIPTYRAALKKYEKAGFRFSAPLSAQEIVRKYDLAEAREIANQYELPDAA